MYSHIITFSNQSIAFEAIPLLCLGFTTGPPPLLLPPLSLFLLFILPHCPTVLWLYFLSPSPHTHEHKHTLYIFLSVTKNVLMRWIRLVSPTHPFHTFVCGEMDQIKDKSPPRETDLPWDGKPRRGKSINPTITLDYTGLYSYTHIHISNFCIYLSMPVHLGRITFTGVEEVSESYGMPNLSFCSLLEQVTAT